MPEFTVSPLQEGLPFGALVTDLGEADIADPSVRNALYDLWIDKGLIVFRGLPDDGAVQIALSGVFGSPAIHPLRDPNRTDPLPELSDIFYRPEEGDVVRFADGTRKGAWLPWHFDLVYMEKINRGGILRAVTKSAHGGETGFQDCFVQYDTLPEDLKARIAGKRVVYHWSAYFEHRRFGEELDLVHERVATRSLKVMERIDMFPPVSHPLTFVQPETGRTALNYSPWYALGIEGMDQDEADALLRALTAHAMDESNAYFHVWDNDDMLLWDNWRTMHCAVGIPADELRHVQRTTIHGDYGYGRPAEDAGRWLAVERELA